MKLHTILLSLAVVCGALCIGGFSAAAADAGDTPPLATGSTPLTQVRATGTPATWEKTIGGEWQYFDEDGNAVSGETTIDGKVYLFGGGHLAQELVPVLHHLDFCCIVLDDREEYVDKALFPDAGQTMLVDFTKLDEILSIRKNDYLVIVTRGHRCDADAEAFALRTGASYIGVVGSRRKTKYVREKLEAQGFTGEQLDSVYAPIGIEIGSETPAEIAISIAAQLIQIRSAKTGKRKGAHPALHT